MRTSSLILLTSLLLGLTATIGFAGPGCGPAQAEGPGHHARQLDRLQQALQLSPEQQAEIRTIVTSRRDATAPLREQQRTLRQELRGLSQADAFDAEKVRQQLHSAVDAKVELMAARHATHQEIAAVLSAEQQALWQQLREQRQAERGQRRLGQEPGEPGR